MLIASEKPVLRMRDGQWVCTVDGLEGVGPSPFTAFVLLKAVLAEREMRRDRWQRGMARRARGLAQLVGS